MNKNDKRYPLTYVMLIGILSLAISWWWMPAAYYYNSDVYISPAGMLISESYRTVPYYINQGIPGYYAQGIFAFYNSWPPLNFLVLAGWQEIVGADVYSSRWLYIVVKLLTDLLCFAILFRITKNRVVSLIAALVFLIFPYRILYSLLLFSDSWILLFGVLITLLLIRAIHKEKLYETRTIFGISLLTGIGTLFSWQVFFYLPAILIYGMWKHPAPDSYRDVNRQSSIGNSKLAYRQAGRKSSTCLPAGTVVNLPAGRHGRKPVWWLAGLLPALILLSLWFYWIIVHPVSPVTSANLESPAPSTLFEYKQSAFWQLLNRSWWGFIQDPATQFVLLLKRIGKTLLEYSPVLILVFYNRYFNKNKKNIPAGESMIPLIRIHGITLILYLAILPGMFAPHEHQIPLFALLATLLLARELTRLSLPWIAGGVIIAFQMLVFFFVVPRIHKVDHALKILDKKIVSLMNPGGETPKALLLLHSGHPDHIGLLAETHTHIYNGAGLRKFRWDEAGLDSSFRAQLEIFPLELKEITDTSNLWILTTDKQICSRKYTGFNIELNRLNDSVCLLHLQRPIPSK